MNATTKSLHLFLLISGTVFCVQAQPPAPPTNGLAAYYPFNGNANDATGHGNDGNVVGATLTSDRFGKTNSAYSFDGASSRITIPDNIIKATNLECTISVWVRTDAGPYNAQQTIFYKSRNNGEMTIVIQPPNQMVFAPHLNSAGWVSAAAPVALNTTVHLVGVYKEGQSVLLYTNGGLATIVAIAQDPISVGSYPSYGSAIGVYNYIPAPSQGFRGTIDDMRFYTRALSASEIQSLYAVESTSSFPLCTPHRATATAVLVNGFVVGATITDGGCGYSNAPLVLIQGGGGSGAAATAVVSNGIVSNIIFTDAGSGYTNAPSIYIYSPLGLQIGLIKALRPSFSDLFLGATYQLQLSSDLNSWTNEGSPFTAIAPTMAYPQYWDVENWSQLFFRLQVVP